MTQNERLEQLPPEILQNICLSMRAPDVRSFIRCNKSNRAACSSSWFRSQWLLRNCPYFALMYACLTGNPTVVRLVLDAGTASTQLNRKLYTSRFYGSPFECAACSGNTHIVEMLLATGIPINMQSKRNALVLAAEKGHAQVVQMLLAAPSVTVKGIDIENAMVAAVKDMPLHRVKISHRSGHVDVVQLLAARASFRAITKAMCSASMEGEKDVVELLAVRTGNHSRKQALSYASKYGSKEVADLLLLQLKERCSPQEFASELNIALVDASVHVIDFNEGLIQLLLDNGGDVNSIDFSTLGTNIDKYERELFATKLLRQFLPMGVNAHNKEAALRDFSYFGYPEAVQLLLESGGFDVNAVDEHGQTALQLAQEQQDFLRESLLVICPVDVSSEEWKIGRLEEVVSLLSNK